MEPTIQLEPIDLSNSRELEWLHEFIWKHHAAPRSVLPAHDELRNPSYRYFRAKAGDIFVGTTCYEVRTPHLVETHKTIIAPQLRGRGYGKAVSRAIEEEARKRGFRKIRTTIYSDNIQMIRIKLEQGYRIEGFHQDHEAPGLHEYSLGKLLKD